MSERRLQAAGRGAAAGALAGLAGAAAMALTAKAEQQVTRRPDSYVPAHTLARLLGLTHPDRDRWPRNMAMHYATGATVGALRGVMAAANLRGPFASLMHANIRLSVDQTLENLTGSGAPPWTWPRDELGSAAPKRPLYPPVPGAAPAAPAGPSPRAPPGRGGRGGPRRA